MKVIFDRSAFHDHFDLLKGSPLLQLANERKVLVYHTATFLEETLKRQGAMARDELRRQWPFLRSICNGGWFKPLLDSASDLKSVCDDELNGGQLESDWPLTPPRVRISVEATITHCIERSEMFPNQDNALQTIAENKETKQKNRSKLVERRNQPLTGKRETFTEYYQSSADIYALKVIEFLSQPQGKLNAWMLNPQEFPHFSAFVELFVYAEYDAERNQNSPLDSNWVEDAQQLCFLLDVDAIISSDNGFMRRAFEALWHPRGKRMFTPDGFVTELSKIH
jgi:hypothetical protein